MVSYACMTNPRKTQESVLMMYNLVMGGHLVEFNDGLHYVQAHSFQLCPWSTITSLAQRSPSTFRKHPALNLLVPLCWRRLVTFDSLSEREDKRRYNHSLCPWRVVVTQLCMGTLCFQPRSQVWRRERRKSSWCTLFAHMLNAMVEFHGELVHTCTYIYW